MGSFAALLRSSARLQAASSQCRNLELALQRWQLYSGVKSYSAKPGDSSDEGEPAFAIAHDIYRCLLLACLRELCIMQTSEHQ